MVQCKKHWVRQKQNQCQRLRIFLLSQTEAPLVVRPYIKNMTQSELFAIMVGGTASIAGSVMAGYAGMGVPLT